MIMMMMIILIIMIIIIIIFFKLDVIFNRNETKLQRCTSLITGSVLLACLYKEIN